MSETRLVITGTPGTGKTFLAPEIARALGAELVDVKKLIENKKLFYYEGKSKEKTADLKKLKHELKKIFSKKRSVVAESHLLCEFRLPADAVVVLRCAPHVLEARLKRRGYGKQKLAQNVLCEALDYCLVRSEENYGAGRVIQIDCTRMPSAGAVVRKIRGRKSDGLDWGKELLGYALRDAKTKF